MLKWKRFGINVGISLLILVLGTFLITILSYINLCKGNFLTISKMLIALLAFFIGPYRQGKQCSKRGFLEGLMIGASILFLFIVMNYIFYQDFHFKNLLYYSILLFLSMMGGMVGISHAKEKK